MAKSQKPAKKAAKKTTTKKEGVVAKVKKAAKTVKEKVVKALPSADPAKELQGGSIVPAIKTEAPIEKAAVDTSDGNGKEPPYKG